MKRLLPHRRDLVWALLLLCVGVLGPFWVPAPREQGFDTWSTQPGGKKVLWALGRQVFGDVRRQAESLLPAEGMAVLCILGPARYPDATEWEQLHRWVSAGGTLVFAAREDDPAVSLEPFGLHIRPVPGRRAALELDESLSSAVSQPIRWEGGAWIDGIRPDAWAAIRSGGRPVAVYQNVGRGLVVALATDEFFQNAWLVGRQKGLLAIRLLEHARRQGGPVVFGESLSTSGPPRVFGLLLSPSVRPVTFQVLALFLLVGWAGSRGFGASFGPERPPRRQIAEHARALGQLHQHTATGGTLVASYLEYFRHELGLGRRAAPGQDPSQLLSRRARMEASSVDTLLGRASWAAEARRVPGREAAAAVRGLAEIKDRVLRRWS